MSTPAHVLKAIDLQVVRGESRILCIPELVIPEGESFCLIGPNGAGKSTLLQALCALIKPSQGETFFRGRKIGVELPVLEYRRKLAMVLQEPLLFNTTVYNNVASGLKIRGMKGGEVRPLVMSSLERFGIVHLKDRSAVTLSGGEARRVSLARALATDPEVLFLDEPFSALDPMIRGDLIDNLEQVLKETRTTSILVTHDLQEALQLSSRLGVMMDGSILQTGSPEDVMNRPVNESVASLVGIETILRGEVIRKGPGTLVASISGLEIEAVGDRDSGGEVLLCIRPENIILSSTDAGGSSSPKNAFRGRIEKIVPQWLYGKVQMDCGFPLVAYVAHHNLRKLSLRKGMEVIASVSPAAIHVIPNGGAAGICNK